jgi:hypothetical protein
MESGLGCLRVVSIGMIDIWDPVSKEINVCS